MSDRAPQRLLVPWSPGPLVDPAGPGPRDELDALVDELFPADEGGPSAFDAVLAVSGLALLTWALVNSRGPGWVVAALALLLLGLVLPARALVSRLKSRGSSPDYLPLDATDRSVQRLVSAYAAVVALQPAGVPNEHVEAAHRAVVEAASLLQGRSPEVAAERDYVEARAAAVERLVAALEADPATQRGDRTARAAIAQAKDELDAAGGLGSLQALDALTREVRDRDAR